jgi:hypothetical protein
LAFILLLSFNLSYAQSEEQIIPVMTEQEVKEQKEIIKKVEKKEKQAAKAEREANKKAKEKKEEEKLIHKIKTKEKSITKNEKKVISLQSKLTIGTQKRKLSPVDIDKMNAKINKLNTTIAKDKEKLAKLIKKK